MDNRTRIDGLIVGLDWRRPYGIRPSGCKRPAFETGLPRAFPLRCRSFPRPSRVPPHPMKLPPLILASASPRRSELLSQFGGPFTVVTSKVPELHADHLTAREQALVNAHRKTRAVAKKHPDALVLGADTLVTLGSHLFGKPRNRAEAARMLQSLQGQTHQVVTGVCLIRLRDHRELLFAEMTDVRFRHLDPAAIQRYLERVDPLDKAGGYAIQEHGELLVEEVFGSFSNVVGLPVERVQAALNQWK